MNAAAEQKHTPGPWGVRAWSRKMSITGNIHQITDEEGYPSAFVPAWDDPAKGEVEAAEEARSNARLIAAAPEMLAALVEMISAHQPETGDQVERRRKAYAQAKGAISKATQP